MLSGVVEPIFSVLGIIMASSLPIIMPYLLAFSAGAMIYVVLGNISNPTTDPNTLNFRNVQAKIVSNNSN